MSSFAGGDTSDMEAELDGIEQALLAEITNGLDSVETALNNQSGGSQIYQDGTPVHVAIGRAESFTIPSDETWVVTFDHYASTGADLTFDGVKVADDDTGNYPNSLDIDEAVFAGGTTIANSDDGSQVFLTGWAV